MPCFHPRKGWVKPGGGVTFSRRYGWEDLPTQVPCGQCIGCRLDRSRDWATRIHHEAQLHDANSFLTLTFAPEHLPPDYSVHTRDLQLFMKRFRKSLGHDRVRFFGCGEYGETNLRPHYHVVVFGWYPSDPEPWRRTGSGNVVYRSAFLEKVWPFGHAYVGQVTVQSAAYVARYVTKKRTGKQAAEHYRRVHPETGEVWDVQPEFVCMSTKPGIGFEWFQKYEGDAFPSDFVTIDGQKRPIPRYYGKLLERQDESAKEAIVQKRKQRAIRHADNNTPDRLAVREEIQLLRLSDLKRELDTDT